VPELVVDGRRITRDGPAYVVAEIGSNHQGDVEKAKALIHAARECGVDAVKLQKRDNRSLYTTALYEAPYDNEHSFGRTYGEHREALELSPSDWLELREFSREEGVTLFGTVFDEASADLLAELGRFGQKTGRGFYRYEAGAERQPDPEVTQLVRAEAERLGVKQRTIEPGEIVTRCILALVNEGALILEEGIAASPGDIDVIWCNGYGFPRHRGGPMFYADTIGLAAVVESIRELAKAHGKRYWTPAPLLVTLAGDGRTFAAWQAARAAADDGDGGGDAA